MLRSRTPFGGSDSCSVAIATTTSLEIEERILNKVYDFFIFKHVNVFYADLNSVVDQCCYIFNRWIRLCNTDRIILIYYNWNTPLSPPCLLISVPMPLWNLNKCPVCLQFLNIFEVIVWLNKVNSNFLFHPELICF